MRQRRSAVAAVFVLTLLAPTLAGASGFGLFQHGGRATGQAGAFTARASDPSAVFYNPAAITQLDGLQIQAGLDFNNPSVEYTSINGNHDSRHIINFPPSLYLTWKPAEPSPWALGIGLDAPFWYSANWDTAFFPGRFRTRQFELQVAELHPVVAYELTDGWSVGGGLRYLYGKLEQGQNGRFPFVIADGSTAVVEVLRDADAEVDALAWDVALHFKRPAWGWGAVFRSPAELKGSGDGKYRPRDVPPGVPGLDAAIAARFRDGSARQSFELPAELRGGFWFAPYPELRIELDASFQQWSDLADTEIAYSPDGFGTGTQRILRNWDDTLSLRLGVEGEITENFFLNGGVALEPSPVAGENREPGFPRGDAMVYAAGFSYNFPQLSFDVGYSLHLHDNAGTVGQELNPAIRGTYKARDQVWAAGARWRF